MPEKARSCPRRLAPARLPAKAGWGAMNRALPSRPLPSEIFPVHRLPEARQGEQKKEQRNENEAERILAFGGGHRLSLLELVADFTSASRPFADCKRSGYAMRGIVLEIRGADVGRDWSL